MIMIIMIVFINMEYLISAFLAQELIQLMKNSLKFPIHIVS